MLGKDSMSSLWASALLSARDEDHLDEDQTMMSDKRIISLDKFNLLLINSSDMVVSYEYKLSSPRLY